MPPGDKTLQKQNTQNGNPIQNENQMQDQDQIQNQMHPPAEETEEDRALRLQAQAARQAREHRESRIRAVREGCRIVMPEVVFHQKNVSVQGEAFARRSNESIGAGKRKMRQGWKRSALYQKEANARLVENGAEAWEASRREIIGNHPLMETPPLEAWAPRIALFMNGEEEKDDELLMHAISGDAEAITRTCKDRFLEMNLNFDLRTDRSFGEAAPELEGLSRKVRELKRLLEACPQVRESLTEDERTDLDTRLDVAQRLSDYYGMRKKVITNARYRSHYNSEISYRYHESDTLEAKNLTVLLWQAESLRSSQSFAHTDDLAERLREYRETVQDKKEAEETNEARARLRAEDAEYGKNDARIEDSRHANYFRELVSQEDNPVVKRLLRAPGYRVTGEAEAMLEPIVRQLSNLPRWKAVQNASPEYVRSMVENLAREPVNAQDPEETGECRRANLEGMRQFKELLKKQTDYLKRKYGNGLPLISIDELARHGNEFANDFTNMQGLGAFLDYLKKLPGLFDPEDESDLEMDRLFRYYDRYSIGEGAERKALLRGSTGSGTYSDYKRKVALASVSDENRVESLIQLSDTMHLDIRWDTVFDESDLRADEIPAALRKAPVTEDIRRWNQLFPETQGMGREEAARYFVEKGTKERIESMGMEELSREACLQDGWSQEEFQEAWVTLRGSLVSRNRQIERWKREHPGERMPNIALAGNAKREQDARAKYEMALRESLAGQLQGQIRALAGGLGNGDEILGQLCQGFIEDLRKAQEAYREQRSQMNPQAQPQVQEQAQTQQPQVRLTRQEAISSYSDQRSDISRRQLAAWIPRLRESALGGTADAVEAYVNGTRYAVGYTEERKRLKNAINQVNSQLEKTPNAVLRQIKDYFDRMTNGALLIPEDARILDFSREKPAEEGRVRGGAKRTEVLRAFNHWSSQKDTPLFSHEPTVNDLKQRFVSNCYMVAATAGVVNLDPYLLKSCIRDNLDGTVTVRLYEKVAQEQEERQERRREQQNTSPMDVLQEDDLGGFVIDDDFAVHHAPEVLRPIYVRVSKEIPRIGGADALSSGALWMQMIEKACAFVGRDGATGYRSLWYGEGGKFLERLMGVPSITAAKDEELFENIRNARQNRIVYNAGTNNDVDERDGLNAGHAYTVMGAEIIAGKRYVRLRNPYSTMSLQEEEGTITRTGAMFDASSDETYGQFYMKFEDFLQKFNTVTYTDLSQI